MHDRKNIRLKGYDYAGGRAYFITICSYKHQSIFGQIENEVMFPNELGKIINEEWVKTEQLRKEITLGVYQIMPNHFHGIIFIHKGSDDSFPLPDVSIFSRVAVTEYENKFGPQVDNLSSIIRGFKMAVTTAHRKKGGDGSVWQSRFHDHIIRNQQELERIETYIRSNPSKWKEDRYFK